MKSFVLRLFITSSLFIISQVINAQLPGTFNYGNDGHIYFFLTNNTRNQVPIRVTAQNNQKRETKTASVTVNAGNVFYFGPNYGWVWEKGEIMTVTYSNGKSYSWTCPATDPAVQSSTNRSNHPYKCEFCNGTGRDFMGSVCAICGGAGWAKMSGTGGGSQGGRKPVNPNTCPTCGGKGQIKKGYGVGYITCSRCKGSGRR